MRSVASVYGNKRTRGQGRTGEFPRLLSGRLCLDFANTIEGPLDPQPEDFLHDYDDLARWSWHAGSIGDRDLGRLTELAQQRPARAAQAFEHALRLRGSIDRIFRAIAGRTEPAGEDLRLVQNTYVEALAAASLVPERRSARWSWQGVEDICLPTWLAAVSAAELLGDGDLQRVKQCPGANDCGWLFYDTSRNGTRRWCSMEGCGSRVKMQRHYAKHRQRAR